MERRRHVIAVEALVPPDAARGATRSAAHSPTVYTNGQKRRREAVFADLCTLLRPHGLLARPSRCNSVHKWQKLCREAILADLCTLLRPHDLLARSSRRNSVHKCPKTAPRGYFSQSVYTLCLRGQANPAGSAWMPTRTTDSCV